ncbi:MAG: gliding motility-associated C-terminal domain-containing protein [Bacteroidetes bacterium]|nr:gliding motility-associated C-terminal domain-containing protein [Bacteroidota bacterium]
MQRNHYTATILSIVFFSVAAKASLKFIPNANQWEQQVKYKADLPGGAAFLEKNCITYALYDAKAIEELHHKNHDKTKPIENDLINCHAFRVSFINSNASAKITTEDKQKVAYNYFIGNDETKWASNLSAFSIVKYNEIYNGIDLKIYSQENNLKYDFIVKPNQNAAAIQMQFAGQDGLSIESNDLHILTSVEKLIDSKPYAYQLINGKTLVVPCVFVLKNTIVSFAFPSGYNKNYTLVIDPVLSGSTYTGSTTQNYGYCATYDSQKNIISAALSFGVGYPTTLGAYQTAFGGVGDIAISKFSPDAQNLIYATYLGGGLNEFPLSLISDNNNNLYILGSTGSGNFPTTNASFDPTFNGQEDAFISQIGPNGNALIASTFMGGGGDDGKKYGDVFLDANGSVLATFATESFNFPKTVGVYQNALLGYSDACVVRLNANLSTLISSTFLGGNGFEAGCSINTKSNGNIVVGGVTETSAAFPTTPNGNNTSLIGGGQDNFLCELSANLTTLVYSTYVGTTGWDGVCFIDLDNQDNVFMCSSSDVIMASSNGTYNTNGNIFLVNFDSTLSTIFFATNLGAPVQIPSMSGQTPTAFKIDKCENIYIAAWGETQGFPVTQGCLQPNTDGFDHFVLVLNKSATTLKYATNMGSNGGWEHTDGGMSRFDEDGTLYQAACTSSPQYPTTTGAYATIKNAAILYDQVVFKINFEFTIAKNEVSISPSDSICLGGAIQFSSLITNTTATSIWGFGDNTSQNTLLNPIHSYQTAGVFQVQLISKDTSVCLYLDTNYITITVIDTPTINLPIDTVICPNNSLTLNPNAGNYLYAWNTGETTPTLTIDDVGEYSVTVTNVFCASSAKTTANKLTIPTFGNDTAFCSNHQPILSAENKGANYLWSTGETTQKISAEKEGAYSVQITIGACSVEKQINVWGNVGGNMVFVPNSFTPNGDGLNDVFAAKGEEVQDFELFIYNRWGELIFSSKNIDAGWNGTYNGHLVENDVYVSVVNYKTRCEGEKAHSLKDYVLVSR